MQIFGYAAAKSVDRHKRVICGIRSLEYVVRPIHTQTDITKNEVNRTHKKRVHGRNFTKFMTAARKKKGMATILALYSNGGRDRLTSLYSVV